jgi:hypothetical protein
LVGYLDISNYHLDISDYLDIENITSEYGGWGFAGYTNNYLRCEVLHTLPTLPHLAIDREGKPGSKRNLSSPGQDVITRRIALEL